MFVRIEASSTYNEMINKLIRVVKKKRAAVIQACSPHSTELGIDLPLPSGHEGFALKNEIVAPWSTSIVSQQNILSHGDHNTSHLTALSGSRYHAIWLFESSKNRKL
jgi:hypothetical protein